MVFEQEVNIFSQGLLNERFNTIQTQFDVTLGKIAAVISDSEVEDYGATGIRMSTKLSSVTQDVNGLTAQFSDLETQYDAAKGEYSSLSSRLTQIDATIDGVSSSVSSVSSNLSNNYSTTSAMNTAIQQSANAITTQVSRTYQTISGMSDYSTTSQVQSMINSSADEIELAVSQEYATQSALNDARNITIVSDTLHYLATSASSGVTTATSGWTTTIQTITETDKYLWTYHTYTYGDGHTSDTTPVITGAYGETGTTIVLYISPSVETVVRDQDGSASPSSLTFTCYQKVGSDNASTYACFWNIEKYANGTWNTISSTNYRTSSITVNVPSDAISVRASAYSDSSFDSAYLLDEQSAAVVQEGADAYTVVLSNANHTFAGELSNAVNNQSTTCNIIAMKGAERVASSIGTISGMPTGMTVSVSDNNTTSNYFTVNVASSMTSANGVLTVPVTVDGKSFSMQFTYSIAFKGDTGVNSATVYLYKRSATSVTAPTDTTTYTFSTGVLTGTLAGWTQTVPSGTNPIYMILAVANSNGSTDTIAASEWSEPVIIAQNGTDGTDGTDGANGYNTAIVNLYQRAVSSPSSPTTTPTYTFSTGTLSAVPTGYSMNIPASNGNPCWVISAPAISRTDTYVIPTNAWSTAVKLVEDGLDGTGIVEVTPVYYAHNSTTAPAAPTAEVTSTSLTGGDWTKSIPAITSTYPYLFTCDQVEYDSTSVGTNGFVWTTVVQDEAIRAIDSRLSAAELLITPESIVSRVTSNATAKESLIEQTASAIRMQADTIAWTSTYSSMTEDGVFTCTGGTNGGFEIASTLLRKNSQVTEGTASTQYGIMLNAPVSPTSSHMAISVRQREYDGSAYGEWANNFFVTYAGRMVARNADVSGTMTTTNASDNRKTSVTGGEIDFYRGSNQTGFISPFYWGEASEDKEGIAFLITDEAKYLGFGTETSSNTYKSNIMINNGLRTDYPDVVFDGTVGFENSGYATIGAGTSVTSVDITFEYPFPSNSGYPRILVTADRSHTQVPKSSIVDLYVTNVSTTGFTLNAHTNTGGGAIMVSWLAICGM